MKTRIINKRKNLLVCQHFKSKTFVLVMAFLFLLGFTHAATFKPVNNGDFNNSNTWGGAAVPGLTDKINYTYWGSTDIDRVVNLTEDAEVSDMLLKGSHLSLTFSASTPTTLIINNLTISNNATFIIGDNVNLVVKGNTSFKSAVFTVNDGASVVFNSKVTSSGGGADIMVKSGGSIDINSTLSITGGATIVDLYGTMELDYLAASGGSQLINVFENGNLKIINDAAFTGSAGFEIKNLGQVNVLGDLSMSGGTSGIVDGLLSVSGTLTVPNYSNPLTITVNPTGSLSAANIEGMGVGGTGLILDGVVLPIELNYFKAFNKNSSISLSWETATEINNDYFTIERSEDAVNFYTIATIVGAGNSNTSLLYNTMDNSPMNGVNYYRLKQTDYNGEYSYSDIQTVKVSNYSIQEIEEVSIYPNPIASPNFLLTIDIPGDYYNESAIIKVFSMTGQEVIEYQVGLEGTFNKTAIDISSFKTGNYVLMVLTSSASFKNKLVVL